MVVLSLAAIEKLLVDNEAPYSWIQHTAFSESYNAASEDVKYETIHYWEPSCSVEWRFWYVMGIFFVSVFSLANFTLQ